MLEEVTRAIFQARTRMVVHEAYLQENAFGVQTTLVEPMLKALGWNLEDPNQFKHAPTGQYLYVASGRKAIDLMVRTLDSERWEYEDQAFPPAQSYVEPAAMLLMTDGNEYRAQRYEGEAGIPVKLFTITLKPDLEPGSIPGIATQLVANLWREKLNRPTPEEEDAAQRLAGGRGTGRPTPATPRTPKMPKTRTRQGRAS